MSRYSSQHPEHRYNALILGSGNTESRTGSVTALNIYAALCRYLNIYAALCRYLNIYTALSLFLIVYYIHIDYTVCKSLSVCNERNALLSKYLHELCSVDIKTSARAQSSAVSRVHGPPHQRRMGVQLYPAI